MNRSSMLVATVLMTFVISSPFLAQEASKAGFDEFRNKFQGR